MNAVRELLQRASDAGGLQTDDVLAVFLPLAHRVAQWHEQGLVALHLAPHALTVSEDGTLELQAVHGASPTRNDAEIRRLERPVSSTLRVVGHGRITSDADGAAELVNLDVREPGGALEHPAYILKYGAWEHTVGHHDELVDIFLLGLWLATLALDRDLGERADLESFVASRHNLFELQPRLHPVVAATIVEMTELDRHRRAPHLASILQRLETYREQPVDLDLARLPGFADAAHAGRHKLVQVHLRDRLFDLSRRNRLVHFRPTQASLNLTIASVPLVLRLNSIRPERLFFWQGDVAAPLCAGKALQLGSWLRFEDQPDLAPVLDRLIASARRDRAEYGFAQLRLAIAFLHWHNLREAPEERISSPLLLLPVELTRKKGVRDQYVLEPTTTEAEVNPALRHQLRKLYDLDLPETLALGERALQELHARLQEQIRASEPAIRLELADQPEIELIHERARQRLAQFKRRQLRRFAAAKKLDYSYDRAAFRPLGLQLFVERIRPPALPQSAAVGGTGPQRIPQIAQTSPGRPGETERTVFTVREERAGNPYVWSFDLCSITLANFNYRKMSLVRDYGTLIEGEADNAAFDRVFSVDPRAIEDAAPPALAPADEWPVVSADATQRAAVALARTGRSYIIQGPPGTGKSQTITNLIADYVARGKRVLFVCEKRAAIDVVFHRLRQQGLDELCCLIHDSQTDKKAFIQDLKQTYESWLNAPEDATPAEERARRMRAMKRQVAQLERLDAAMVSVPATIGVRLHELLRVLVTQRAHATALSARDAESVPSFDVWRRHTELARRLAATLAEIGPSPLLARHPFRALCPELLAAERPVQRLEELCDAAETTLAALEQALEASVLPGEHWDTLEEIEQITTFAQAAEPLARRGQLALLDERGDAFAELGATSSIIASLCQELERARERTVHWREKLDAADARAALAEARASERSLLRFLKPSWWRLQRILKARYDFAQHAVRPRLTPLLEDLAAEHALLEKLADARAASVSRYGIFADELHEAVSALHASCRDAPALDALRTALQRAPAPEACVVQLARLARDVEKMLELLPAFVLDFRAYGLAELAELIRDLREEASSLPDVVPLLVELDAAPPELGAALRRLLLTPDELEAAAARKALEGVYRTERWLASFTGRSLEHCTERIATTAEAGLAANARAIREAVRQRFREHVQLSTVSATQLDADQKAFKRSYATGRRELEHEFGKTMRYKSIRDLAAGDSGGVVRDLKPIWLMSPLSVSDTLPLETDLFDVVIFDEASQIPVEEAVPALYRAQQVIVVGDEMQLPPTSFFSTAQGESSEIELDEEGQRIAIALDADSLLAQSARNLPATLLAWHYRSRSESLIAFSNAAFYAGELFTIPDRELPAPEQPEIVIRDRSDAARHVEALLARPLSFHFMESSPYQNRRNPGEAAYIAELVRELLLRGTSLSIGVVAFSEAQQGEIEDALDELASRDPRFAAALEAAYTREEDDQFCGLFVKNLENVQGDERDVILLSICYGPDAGGRMAMNFGPINQRGGEKRLNVIFSRARARMAVVSSIRHSAITNDSNDGAAALKGFLRYAQSCSSGALDVARGVLQGLNPLARKGAPVAAADPVAAQLARALRARGHVVDEHVGQSRFRCDLAVRRRDEHAYRLGLLIDTEEFYANRDVTERCVTRPELLRRFAWSALTVLARDWYHAPEAVLARIERQLAGESEEALSESEASPADDAPASAPAAEPSAAAAQPDTRRRCEHVAGSSAKFWEVERGEGVLTIRFGRIGSEGQLLTKRFESAERAARELEKLFAEKLRKGYTEVR